MKTTIISVYFTIFIAILTAQPLWVKQFPVDSAYYIGIGSAEKTGRGSNHIAIARDRALSQIAAEIAVTIISDSRQSLREEAGLVKETFESNISSLAKNELSGYELVDSWENRREYKVYYRLSKAIYEKQLNNKLEIIAKSASYYLTQGDKAEVEGDIAGALKHYLTATNEIGEYRGMGIKFPESSSNDFVDVILSVKLNNLLNNIQLNCHPNTLKHSQFQEKKNSITVTALFKKSEGRIIPIQNLSLVSIPDADNITHSFLQPTDSRGQSSFEINSAQTSGIIRITPDLSSLKQEAINIPEILLTVELMPVKVFFAQDEMNNGIKSSIIGVILKQFLTQAGWQIVDTTQDADLMIKLSANARNGVEIHSIFTAFADGDISISANKKEIFRQSFNRISGTGTNYEEARKQALQGLGELMTSEIDIAKILSN